MEALIGAYYLDSGIKKTSDFIVNVIIKFKLKDLESNPISDYKSLVQEFVQKNTHMLPNYTTIKEDGPEHQKTFTVELIFTVNKKRHSFFGNGSNKKRAQQNAAKCAYESFISKKLTD